VAALAALLATAAAAATPATSRPVGRDVEPASPLVALAATLDAATLPGQEGRLADLRAIEAELARTPGPDDECSQSLGAARFGALHSRLALARQALGDRRGAMDAWQRALDCDPRNPRHHVALGSLLLTFGDLEGTRARVERAARLGPRQPGLEELQARLAFVAGDWPDAIARAQRIATRLEGSTPAGAAATSGDDEGAMLDPATGDASDGEQVAAFWRLLALLAQRRSGSPVQDVPAPDLAPENRWPAPLWRHVAGNLDERSIVAAIAAQDAARRREMTCEALYYTAQLAFANGRHDEGRGRLARAVNLKVLYYVEHDMALAELARLRRP
jgi:tetratricopeptide (TPR) repeat protein